MYVDQRKDADSYEKNYDDRYDYDLDDLFDWD
jgi:hypothetical protein